jgi:hypothetical protein
MKLPTAGHFWLFGHLRVGTNLFFDLIAQNCINLVSVNRIFFEQICNLPEDDFEKYVKNNLDKTLVHKISNNYERLRSVIESYPHVKIFQYRRSIRDQLLSYKSSTLMRKWHWDNDADTQGLEQIKHKFKEEQFEGNFREKTDNDMVETIYFDWIRVLDCYEQVREKQNTYLIQLEELQNTPHKYFSKINLRTKPSPTMIKENTNISISNKYTNKFKEIVVRAKSLGLDVEEEF